MPNYTNANGLTDCTSTFKACPHENGWYFIVKFWGFKKKLFWCSDCNDWFKAKYIKKMRKERKEK